MLRLTPDQYRTLCNLKRQTEGRRLLELLEAALEDAHATLRTATGEQVGWQQGRAQCVAEWLRWFEEAERVGKENMKAGEK